MKPRDRVKLLRDVGELPAGVEGVIFGYLRRPEGDAFAVAFGGPSLILEPEEIEPVADDAAPPETGPPPD